VAAHCVAIAGTRDDARIWLPWIRKLAAFGVESSMEWPVSLRRLEGLLWLRSGKTARARVVLQQAATWARGAGYTTEGAVSALTAGEAANLLEARGGTLAEDALEGERALLLSLGIDPLFDLQGVPSAALAGSHQKEPILTAREVEVLRLLAEDLTYREIGEELGISWQTVRTMAHNVYEKLGAKGKRAAAIAGSEMGLL
jgi:ATP/maltotriose-dependent transcriptional regulator MalT